MKKKLLIVLGIFCALVAVMFLFLTDGLKEGLSVPLNGVDLSRVEDGVYVGAFETSVGQTRWRCMSVITP